MTEKESCTSSINTYHVNKTICFLVSLCMFLSAVEMAIPKPLPFLRLGLANLPIIIAIKYLDFKDYLSLVLLKVIFQALISGTVFSYIFLFSICGTFASALSMYGLYKLAGKKVSNIGLSVTGAFFNNSMQILLSWVILYGDSTFFIIPLILGFGFITGLLLGIICNYAESHSNWIKMLENQLTNGSLCDNNMESTVNKETLSENLLTNDSYKENRLTSGSYMTSGDNNAGNSSESYYENNITNGSLSADCSKLLDSNNNNASNIEQTNGSKFNSKTEDCNNQSVNQNKKRTLVSLKDILLYVFILALMAVILLVNVLYVKWIGVLFLTVLTLVKGKRIKVLPYLFMVLSVVFMALLVPYGKVLFTIGSWNITLGALESGLRKSSVLCGMVLASRIITSARISLPGKAGEALNAVLTYYGRLNEGKLELKKGRIFSAVDERLCSIFSY